MTEAEQRFIYGETDLKPNAISWRAMLVAGFVMLSVLIMNELGVFRVQRALMRISCLAGLVSALTAVVFGKLPATREKKYVKYIYMAAAILITFFVTSLMNFHTTLCLILPMIMATQYKTEKLALIALAGSMVVTFAAPILSFGKGIWDTLFLQVLLQLCGFDSAPAAVPFFTMEQSMGQIALYIVLPREMIIILFGLVTTGIVNNAKNALNDRLELMRGAERERNMQFGMLDGLAAIIDSRDGSTGMHVLNTKRYTEMMLNYMLGKGLMPDKVTPEFARMVINASPLHDIGKISIPDSILNKPGRFSEEEFEIMKTHPSAGDSVIRRMFCNDPDRLFAGIVQDVVYFHHENYDGTGYPNGIRGDGIPLAARIVAITDSFDAMTATRVYKKGIAPEEALQALRESSGKRFDGELVEIFINAWNEYGGCVLNA